MGGVAFEPMGEARTRIRLRMEYEPEDIVKGIGDKLGFVSRRVDGDLKRFKEFHRDARRRGGRLAGPYPRRSEAHAIASGQRSLGGVEPGGTHGRGSANEQCGK